MLRVHWHGVQAGLELMFDAMMGAANANKKLTMVICSSMGDLAAVIQDPRWEELAPLTVR